ncbi:MULTISPECIES: hypothetical protein [Bacillus]|uniref:hypothetical protein n=1 Tax=Bacillus TaxID=1386 RepID=UPI001581A7E4|nr:hypothetical protein [Bacillus glycinifermentans]MBU8786862.1 hypothetical protein [Bacillus glycinifermentans]NUJ16078.1 hypothetical protein [Bacillus glycinifermentans]
MAENFQNDIPAVNVEQLNAQTAQILEQVNNMISGFGQSISDLVQQNGNVDLSNVDWTNNQNLELNQSIQNLVNDYIQSINSLNSQLNGTLGQAIDGTIVQKNNDE